MNSNKTSIKFIYKIRLNFPLQYIKSFLNLKLKLNLVECLLLINLSKKLMI